MDEIVTIDRSALSATIAKARDYITLSKSANTRRAYRSDLRHFMAWCSSNGYEGIPTSAHALSLYLTDLADSCRVSTIQRRLAAISEANKAAGHPSPTTHTLVRHVLAGIRRDKGTAQRGKSPILIDDIRKIVLSLPASIAGIRDKAILLVGFSGAFRRSELVSIDIEDIEFEREGMVISMKRSKTDQEGAGCKKAIPYGNHGATCPVLALREWLSTLGISEGAVFRGIDRHGRLSDKRLSGHAVARIIKRLLVSVGEDPSRFAGHSLRAGMATQAAINGASESSIMSQTGHKSVAMLRRYIRDGNLFRDNAAGKVGL